MLRVVTVAAGDTLWDIAAVQLGPVATSADIAAEWPRWFVANRQVIGDDPDLIYPGERLAPPPYHPLASSLARASPRGLTAPTRGLPCRRLRRSPGPAGYLYARPNRPTTTSEATGPPMPGVIYPRSPLTSPRYR